MTDYEHKGRYIVEFQDIPAEREHQIEIEVDERRDNYDEVELGFDEERALREGVEQAKRESEAAKRRHDAAVQDQLRAGAGVREANARLDRARKVLDQR